jgi:hypothetical protein
MSDEAKPLTPKEEAELREDLTVAEDSEWGTGTVSALFASLDRERAKSAALLAACEAALAGCCGCEMQPGKIYPDIDHEPECPIPAVLAAIRLARES